MCWPAQNTPVQRVPTLSALWSMRSPQVICYPVEPSAESADTVSTLEYEVSTGHMLPSRTQPSTESADTVSTLGYEVSTGHMLPSRTQPSTESADTVSTLGYEV